MDALTGWMAQAEELLYHPFALPLLLVLVGGVVTVWTGFVQVRRFPFAVARTFAGIFRPSGEGSGTITSFQALSTALAATVGNGNIAGVATAILIGGPGAVFWMWITAIAGMATKYAEAVLGVHYRVTRETGEMAAGPMYYIVRGIPHAPTARTLAVLFAVFGAATALFGTGNMVQSNAIARTFVEAARSTAGITPPQWMPGIVITIVVGLILLGGIRRIAAVAERLVPSMIVLYISAAVVYIVLNANQIPTIFLQIVNGAFTPLAAVGGVAGASIAQVVAAGISRGVLSNEAGLGSGPIAHGIAKVKHPCEQGVVSIFEVFTDTIVVCSMTAFVIISSGLWTDPGYQGASADLTAAAFGTTIPYAQLLVAVCSFLFGLSTLLGWAYYGEKCIEFLIGSRVITPYRAVFTVFVLIGSVAEVRLAFAIGTLFNGFMAFPNLIGVLFLVGTVRRLTREFFYGETETGAQSPN